MAPPKLVIFDFDGTLLDTQRAIVHSLTMTFKELLPSYFPSESEIQRLMGTGMGIKDVLNALHPDPSTLNEEEWTSTYRQFYATQGQQFVKPFEGAEDLLRFLQSRDIPIAIVSNKGVASVISGLVDHGFTDYIPEYLVIGDSTPGATRKPDSGSFVNVLVPALKERGLLESIDASDVFMIGDTEPDLKFASNIGGAKSIWCRFGHGDQEGCEKLKPDATIDSLTEVKKLVDEL